MINILQQIVAALMALIGATTVMASLVGGTIIPAAPLAAGGMSEVSFENLDSVTKEEGIYRITFDKYSDVEIKDQNTPEVKLRKWGDETYIKVTYPDILPVSLKEEDSKLKWVNGNKEVHLYPIEKGFEFEIVLLEKPASNKIVINIESQGLNFYYQPELTQKEKDEGAFRPENIIGSYAVYHESKTGNYEAFPGGKNYMAGKAFHIYRPRINDAEGKWAWSEQEFILDENGNGQQIITIPQDFLDNAVYPIRHAGGDTFGYTTEGSSNFGSIAQSVSDTSEMFAMTYNLSEDGNVTQMSAALAATNVGQSCDLFFAIYREDSAGADSHGLVASAESLNVAITFFTPTFHNISFASELLVADDYILAALGNGEDLSAGSVRIYYDAGATHRYYREQSAGAGSYATRKAEDPWTEVDSSGSYLLSIYATYTPTAGEEEEEESRRIEIKGIRLELKGQRLQIK